MLSKPTMETLLKEDRDSKFLKLIVETKFFFLGGALTQHAIFLVSVNKTVANLQLLSRRWPWYPINFEKLIIYLLDNKLHFILLLNPGWG